MKNLLDSMMMKKPGEPIAIIGSGCRFPGGCTSPSKLWDLLKNPVYLNTAIPPDRFNTQSFYHPNGSHHGTTNSRHAYLLSDGCQQFDAGFFSIQTSEAESMDPQQRLLLETVYESVEAAGLKVEDLRGSDTGVYVGVMSADYYDLLARDIDSAPKYMASGTARSILANRISYFFDWRGPSISIDTACSSSLVAVNQAVQLLRSGCARIAVAAGTNLILSPEMFITESKLQMLSPTGQSRMWDAEANGYARGEGITAIVLKPLGMAIEDGDDIECVIREIGVNQDGRTTGLTLPNQKAQAALIRETYERAGLDLNNVLDHCQFFEAHGTGTSAGDPREAEAIAAAFSPARLSSISANQTPLYVGSIKTIIGHTEGAAGIAGILKASLAIKHGVMPPNLHFNRLNPEVEPFYKHLEIVQKARAWGHLPPGIPRRVSVNSFGFGGTNAHAILESYSGAKSPNGEYRSERSSIKPFVFSAASERALLEHLKANSSFLQENLNMNLDDLAWTLSVRRSEYQFRIAYSARSIASLCEKIMATLRLVTAEEDSSSWYTRQLDKDGIVAVFTGQGAQWASMGACLLSFQLAHDIIGDLEMALATLPKADRPSWSLKQELVASENSSRISEAEISQPLCVAIQILATDILKVAGIAIKCVIGHSSGEIASAYAAGFLSAKDAIRIAYYRGRYARLASGSKMEVGGMLAAALSMQEAEDLCGNADFKGRLSVAASNAQNSVTLSGDLDAIKEAKEILDDDKTFSRLLRVDTAYHSHHMIRCASVYQAALESCDIQIRYLVDESPVWYSSVYAGLRMTGTKSLKSTYWVENMVRPVLFSQALELATAAMGPFALGIEVGPHPALKGPVTDCIPDLPYIGCFQRGVNDIDAVTDALGFVWAHIGSAAVDFNFSQPLLCGGKSDSHSRAVIKGLPSYSWKHDRVYWGQSRSSKVHYQFGHPRHELLGTRHQDGSKDMRWSNELSPSEIPWLHGHSLQGYAVFPAAAYVIMAFESATFLADGKNIKLIDLLECVIPSPISFDNETSTVETIFTLTGISTLARDGILVADFALFSVPAGDKSSTSSVMVQNARGRLRVTLGDCSGLDYLQRLKIDLPIVGVDPADFYAYLHSLGYNYGGDFRGILSLNRRLGLASGTVQCPVEGSTSQRYMVHPAALDVVFQSVFAAFAAPYDGRQQALLVPTSIQRVSIQPSSCESNLGSVLYFDTYLPDPYSSNITADISVRGSDAQTVLVQVEGIHLMPIAAPSVADDRRIFSRAIWNVAYPDSNLVAENQQISSESHSSELAGLCERVAFFYLRWLDKAIPPSERVELDLAWHHQSLFDFADHVQSCMESAEGHPYVHEEWIKDTYSDIIAMMKRASGSIDLALMKAVCENLPSVIKGQSSILEHMATDDMLDNYYQHGLGFPSSNDMAGGLVAQLAHKFPRMNILEIGAGTGGTTKSIINALGDGFASYTYTDIATQFFEKAQEKFAGHSEKMIFQMLDIEKNPIHQGFISEGYDLVIAMNVLHATASLDATLANVRRLVKPGGYLCLIEVTNTEVLRLALIMGGLPGWWVGKHDGRLYSPGLPLAGWDSLLKRTGFSGVDTVIPNPYPLTVPISVFMTQAVNERITYLRDPLQFSNPSSRLKNLIVIGSPKLEVVTDLLDILDSHYERIISIPTLDDVAKIKIPLFSAVLSIIELEWPMFKTMTVEKWDSMKKLFESTRSVLWITRGYRAEEPYCAMTVGFLRALALEMPHLRLQLLDFEHLACVKSKLLAEMLLRLHLTEMWDNETGGPSQWLIEPEYIYKDERLYIPRQIQDEAQNNRYNSSSRPIHVETKISDEIISIEADDDSFILRKSTARSALDPANYYVNIQVSHSLLISFRFLSSESLFIVYGTNMMTGRRAIALASQSASCVTVAREMVYEYEAPLGREEWLLLSTLSFLFLKYITSFAADGSKVMIHEPDPLLLSALCKDAALEGRNVLFTTSKMDQTSQFLVFVHRYATRQEYAPVFSQVSMFVDLSSGDSEHIKAHLPRHCRVETTTSLKNSGLFISTTTSIHTLLQVACERFSSQAIAATPVSTIPLKSIEKLNPEDKLWSVVAWPKHSTVYTKALRASENIEFSDSKTYLLVGLSARVGQSLCEWMVARGAKFVALASRTPAVSSLWLNHMISRGATIKVIRMDVTSEESVQRAVASLQREVPPICGVANGAMVPRDVPFLSMSLETFLEATMPKVEGSQYLDGVFRESNLDFFILFSSFVSIPGNAGQSNYCAANAYMTSLAASRRNRGQNASVIHISALEGLGYLSRAGKNTRQKVSRLFLHPISEVDLLEQFAEAIMIGRSDRGNEFEITTGAKEFVLGVDESESAWLKNPRFSHLARVVPVNITHQEQEDKESASNQLKKSLSQARTHTEIVSIITDALLMKIRTILMSDDDISIDTSLVDLGMDSLGAVEIRTWLLKELICETSTLKILNGSSAKALAEDALTRLSPELIPCLQLIE